MKLEAIDKMSSGLVCVASVANVMAGRILVHFDGWELDYDYWVVPNNSPYIHPVGWCAEVGIELNSPNGTLEGENVIRTLAKEGGVPGNALGRLWFKHAQ